MVTNQQIKFFRSLGQKKFRDETGLFIAEGLKLVEEAILNRPEQIKSLIISSKFSGHLHATLPGSAETIQISPAEFERISSLKSPQGILVVLKKPEEKIPSITELENIVLVLDQISDPGNLGTIIRLADWFGIRFIICSKDTVECFNPKVVQASMGSLFRVQILYTDLDEYLNETRQKTGLTTYATSLTGSNIYQTHLKIPALIILGNESNGISGKLEHYIDHSLLIPNFSITDRKTESLNVSVAAAIVCSEFRRQTG
jgi:RNA methyltransferase, TrmH family